MPTNSRQPDRMLELVVVVCKLAVVSTHMKFLKVKLYLNKFTLWNVCEQLYNTMVQVKLLEQNKILNE